jgi:hypothetical protein
MSFDELVNQVVEKAMKQDEFGRIDIEFFLRNKGVPNKMIDKVSDQACNLITQTKG